MTSYMTDIEREAKNNLRNKKFYEYYSEIMKIAKQVLDGKKTKECKKPNIFSIFRKMHQKF